MLVESFGVIEEEFVTRVNKIVWCSVASVDSQGRPRTRILHPIWEGLIGWIATGRQSLKSKHLDHTPFLSLCYIDNPITPIYVDCKAEWADDSKTKQGIWDLFARTPPPLGYDPAPFFGAVNDLGYGVLKLSPYRIVLGNLFGETRVWMP